MSDSVGVLEPDSLESLQQLFGQHERVLAVGGQTKPPLWRPSKSTHQLISLRRLSGVIEYEPSEFTITVRSGTPVAEVVDVLADRGQYLPFDPMLIDAGSTIGGMVAAGMNGAGRFRYGSIRDFLLGVQFIDGNGKLIHGGGKVVKNAAGFDIPKLLVGSVGRLGVMTEMTFKVFPRPASEITLVRSCDSHSAAAALTAELARGRWEIDALDYCATKKSIHLRIAGEESVNAALAKDVERQTDSQWNRLSGDDSRHFWNQLGELNLGDQADFIWKLPTTQTRCVELSRWADSIAGTRVHASSAMGTVLLSSPNDLRERLKTELPEVFANNGLLLRGDLGGDHAYLLPDDSSDMRRRLKSAFDPLHKFP